MSLKKLKVKFINWLFKDTLELVTIDGITYVYFDNPIGFKANLDFDAEEKIDEFIENMLQQNDLMYQRNK